MTRYCFTGPWALVGHEATIRLVCTRLSSVYAVIQVVIGSVTDDLRLLECDLIILLLRGKFKLAPLELVLFYHLMAPGCQFIV